MSKYPLHTFDQSFQHTFKKNSDLSQLTEHDLQQLTLGDWAYYTVHKHTDAIFKNEEDAIADRDPEAIHKMRVGMRRLRADLAAFQLAVPWHKTLNDLAIAKIARILGDLRDLDVLSQVLAQQYIPQLPESEQAQLHQYLVSLKADRKAPLKRVRLLLKSHKYAKFHHHLETWLNHPYYLPPATQPLSLLVPDLLLPIVSQFLLHPIWIGHAHFDAALDALTARISEQTTTVQFSNKSLPDSELASKLSAENQQQLDDFFQEYSDALHHLRKQAKRVRYTLEIFADYYPPNSLYQQNLQVLKALQECLGSLQDNCVLVDFLEVELGNKVAQKMPEFNRLLSSQRWAFIQTWQLLRTQFLDPNFRHQFRDAVLLKTTSIMLSVDTPQTADSLPNSLPTNQPEIEKTYLETSDRKITKRKTNKTSKLQKTQPQTLQNDAMKGLVQGFIESVSEGVADNVTDGATDSMKDPL